MKKTTESALSAMGAVLIAVCSWVSIPASVPFTLQNFAIYLVLTLFGSKIGLQSIITYILIGAIGVPVFSGFHSGVSALLGMTGGYIVGFVFIGLSHLIAKKVISDKPYIELLSLVIGTVLCYLFGTAWFIIVYAKTNEPIEIVSALTLCVLPFVIPDAIKLVLAMVLSKRLRRILHR